MIPPRLLGKVKSGASFPVGGTLGAATEMEGDDDMVNIPVASAPPRWRNDLRPSLESRGLFTGDEIFLVLVGVTDIFDTIENELQLLCNSVNKERHESIFLNMVAFYNLTLDLLIDEIKK